MNALHTALTYRSMQPTIALTPQALGARRSRRRRRGGVG